MPITQNNIKTLIHKKKQTEFRDLFPLMTIRKPHLFPYCFQFGMHTTLVNSYVKLIAIGDFTLFEIRLSGLHRSVCLVVK